MVAERVVSKMSIIMYNTANMAYTASMGIDVASEICAAVLSMESSTSYENLLTGYSN